MYQLKPNGKTEVGLFDHIVTFKQRDPELVKCGEDPLEPSSYLNVDISDDQHMLLHLTERSLMMQNIMQGAGGMGADQKLAKHKLDQFGCIKS